MKIIFDDFFEVFSDGRIQEETITVYDNGRIKISKSLFSKIEKKTVAVKMAFDYKKIILEPEGENIRLKADGSFQAKNMVSKIEKKKELFPLVYKMQWCKEHNCWVGTKCDPRKMNP